MTRTKFLPTFRCLWIWEGSQRVWHAVKLTRFALPFATNSKVPTLALRPGAISCVPLPPHRGSGAGKRGYAAAFRSRVHSVGPEPGLPCFQRRRPTGKQVCPLPFTTGSRPLSLRGKSHHRHEDFFKSGRSWGSAFRGAGQAPVVQAQFAGTVFDK